MYRIQKDFEFSASHQLDGLSPGHQCGRLHGHNYIVRVVLESATLNDVGFVLDYGELKGVKEYIDNVLDHRHLNDVWKVINPTAEHMAMLLFTYFSSFIPYLTEVHISETPKTWAVYRR